MMTSHLASRPKFGVVVPTMGAAGINSRGDLRSIARSIEDSALTSIWVGDHIVWRCRYLDALDALAAFSSLIDIEIGTSVLQLGLRRPIDLAHRIGTIATLSDGKLILGIGVGGDYAPEWAAAGVPLAQRGLRTDECLKAVRGFWSGGKFDGQVYSVDGTTVAAMPSDEPPIYVGGRSNAAMRRASSEAGYIGIWRRPTDYLKDVEYIESLRESNGQTGGFTRAIHLFVRIAAETDVRSSNGVREALVELYGPENAPRIERYVVQGSVDQVATVVQSYCDIGVTQFILHPVGDNFSRQLALIDTMITTTMDA